MRVRKKKKTGSGQSWTFIIRQSEQQKENVLQVIWGSHVRYRDASAFLMSKASASFSLFFPRTVDSFPPSLILFLVSCFFPLSLVSHFLSVAAAKKKKKKPLPHIFAFIWRGDGGWGGPKALFQVESKSFDMLQYQFHAQFIYSLGTLIVNYFQIRCIFFCHIILLECWYPSSAKFRDLKLQAL